MGNSSNIGYYLSTNSVLDAQDIFIGSSAGSALAASGTSSRSVTLTIPSNTSTGSYYLLFVADYLKNVSESNEDNNVSSVAFSVVPPMVDFTISSLYLYASSLTAGSSLTVEGYIYNQGNTASNSSTVGYYLSTNSTLDAADVFIGSFSGNAVSASSSHYFYSTVTVPANTTAGSYYLISAADYLNSVAEENETNNTASRQITVVSPSIDLVVQSPSLSPTSAIPGSAVTSYFTLSNQGNSTASSSNVGFYLSSNATFDATDVFIGSSTGTSIEGNRAYYRSATVTIPSNASTGAYYILFRADYLNSVSETNEDNNVAAVAFSVVTPNVDLNLQSPGISSSSIPAGSQITVTSTAYNLGNMTASSSNMGYYLSANSTLDANDILVGFANGSSISPGTYNYASKSSVVTIPSNTTPGNYYLIQAIDYLNSITESNENNNTVSSYFSVTDQGTNFLVPVSGSTSFTTCTGKVYDNGGTGNYSQYSNGSLTINPATPGNKVQLSFVSFSIYNYYDYLEIYDGTSTSAPLIGRYNYNSPNVVTASNTSGALTLRFYSSGYYTYPGFEANISCVTPAIDLSIFSGYPSSNTLSSGTSFSTTGFIVNTGTTSSASSNIGYYLSPNSTLEATDLYLGRSTGGLLTSQSSSKHDFTLSLPSTVTAGSYQLLFVADPTNDVQETDETNNVRAAAITVTSANTIDLSVTARTLSATSVVTGASVNATATLSNTGNTASPKSAVGFYLSTNTTWEPTDVLLVSKQTASTLAASGSEVLDASLTIPSSTVAGNYYILFVPDPENHIAETNETNGVMSLALTVTNNIVDLIVQDAALSPTSLLAGATTTATSKISNQGSVSAASSTMGYYLSANTTLEASDVALTTTTGGALAGSASADKSVTLTIPAGTTAGNYYVLFVADPANEVTEGTENNNVSSVALTVLPQTVDLVLQTPTLSVTSLVTGGSVTATTIIRNAGTVSSSASNVGYYLSTNTTFDATDVALGTSTGGALAAGATAEKTASLTIPATTAPGNYYVLFVADPAGEVTESNETNNTSSIALTVTAPPSPDLVVETFYITPSTSFIKGTAYTVATIIKNQGNATSSASSVGVYLSSDLTLDAADILLAEATGSSLTQNATATLSRTVTIPASTATGSYYLLIKADHKDAVTESNETNNLKYSSIIVLNPTVDLFINNVTASINTLSAGYPITVSARINNDGNSTAISSNVGFYLSTDNTFDSNDIVLGTISGNELASGTNATKSGTFVVPTGTPDGNYYLLTVADPSNAVPETNEANNVAVYVGFSVYPASVDLVLRSSMISSATAAKGSTLNVSTSIMNSRTLAASSSNVGYYLSTNNTYESSDVLLGTSTGGALAAGATGNKNATLTIPANTAAGNYYILFLADPGNEVTESDEKNNLSAISLTVTEPNAVIHRPDLIVKPTTRALGIVPAGSSVKLSGWVTNQGKAVAAATKVSFYISQFEFGGDAPLPLGSIDAPSLAPGENYQFSTSVVIPPSLAHKNYFLIIYVNAGAFVSEEDTNNNMDHFTITVSAPTGIKELSPEHELTLWPNPTTDKLAIEAKGFKNNEKSVEITMYSASGQKVISQKAAIVNQGLKASLDVAHLNHGLYLVHIQVGDTLTIRRIVIRK
ncbi:hypothetical protein GCM10011405_01820 [Rufibacter glacialis]|nr:hypothetical protein GCM10011405_01820 [Rufibacter glacialis]